MSAIQLEDITIKHFISVVNIYKSKVYWTLEKLYYVSAIKLAEFHRILSSMYILLYLANWWSESDAVISSKFFVSWSKVN